MSADEYQIPLTAKTPVDYHDSYGATGTRAEFTQEDDISATGYQRPRPTGAVQKTLVNVRDKFAACDCTPKFIKKLFTLERLKILIILLVLVLALFMFSSQSETNELNLNLRAINANYSYVVPLARDLPQDVVEVIIGAQVLPSNSNSSHLVINIILEGKRQLTEVHATVIDIYTVTLDSLFEIQGAIHRFNVSRESQSFFNQNIQVRFATTSAIPLAITSRIIQMYWIVNYEVIFAAGILVLVYILIIFELVHRTIAALLGSFLALALLSTFHERPPLHTVVSWIDFDTIGLLFGMMLMVGIFSQTGFFEWSAIKAFKLAKGDMWRLTIFLCIFTAVVSAFLDNVTTILLLTPVTIRLCKVLDVPPMPILLAEVMCSNIGGTATVIGDPPNIIIVSDRRIKADGTVTFGSFMAHMLPGVLVALVAVFIMFNFTLKHQLSRQPHQAKRKEIEIWIKTASKIDARGGGEEKRVKEQLQEYIARLEQEIATMPDEEAPPLDITALEQKYIITDTNLFANSCVVLGSVILMFFLHSAIHIDLSLAWIAIIGAMVHLVVSGIRDIEEVLEKVELGTLMFFAGLFVLMHALEEMGLVDFIAEITVELIKKVPPGTGQLALAVTLLVWVSAIISAFIDNIPFTTTMVPVIVAMSTDLGLPLGPLVWSLAFGACFGGNGTLIGASANVVSIGLAESAGYPITFLEFFKVGFPVMLVSTFLAYIYLMIFHVAIQWGYEDFGNTPSPIPPVPVPVGAPM